ncbi:MAG: hypothetical protein QXF12_03695 [Candidatus Aenigmatarchaeota archaeon]
MLASTKYRISSKLLFAFSNPDFIEFKKDGDKYILDVPVVGMKVIISKECVDFVINEETFCVKVDDEVYKIVKTAYIIYKILPLTMFVKKAIKALINALK